MFITIIRESLRSHRRAGAALVEFAICIPVFFILAMGTVEVCRLLYLRQSLKIAAFECAKLGVIPDVAPESLQDQCDVILQNRRVVGYTLSYEPNDLKQLSYGKVLSVTISRAVEPNLFLGQWFYHSDNLIESVALTAEY